MLKISYHIFTMELRKIFSYRFDFWVNFLGVICIEILVAYFVWSNIYQTNRTSSIAGFSFPALMYYYSISPILMQILQAQTMHFISDEIYQGTLNRYIVLPLSFIQCKLISHYTFALVSTFQLALAVWALYLVFGFPQDTHITGWTLAGGLLSAWFGALLYFLMAASLEMVAFWTDNVWSLNVTLRFLTRLLGGVLVPMSFFPEWSQKIIYFLPFWSISGLPIEISLGRISFQDALRAECVALAWTFAFVWIVRAIWQRGRLQYSGVGI